MKGCLAYIIGFLVAVPLFCSSTLVQNELFVRPARLSDLVAGPLRVGQYVATDRFNVGNKLSAYGNSSIPRHFRLPTFTRQLYETAEYNPPIIAHQLPYDACINIQDFQKPEEWQYLTQYNTPAKDKWQGFLPIHF